MNVSNNSIQPTEPPSENVPKGNPTKAAKRLGISEEAVKKASDAAQVIQGEIAEKRSSLNANVERTSETYDLETPKAFFFLDLISKFKERLAHIKYQVDSKKVKLASKKVEHLEKQLIKLRDEKKRVEDEYFNSCLYKDFDSREILGRLNDATENLKIKENEKKRAKANLRYKEDSLELRKIKNTKNKLINEHQKAVQVAYALKSKIDKSSDASKIQSLNIELEIERTKIDSLLLKIASLQKQEDEFFE